MLAKEIITSVQSLLQDDQFSSVQILEAANWVQSWIFNEVATRQMESSDTILASAGDVTATFPDDMQTMISLFQLTPAQIDLKRRYINHEDFLSRYFNYQIATAMPLQHWTDFSNALRFSAPLDTDISMAIDYLRKPIPMVGLNDVCEISDDWREIISRATLARCMEQNEDYAEAQQERENIAPLVVAFKLQEGRGQIKAGPVIMKNNRRRAGSSGRGGAFNDY